MLTVTIDGPAASGKSSTARMVAAISTRVRCIGA
ncbi:MAG: (d)CMP kinase [Gemmatimonadetes bacterium]|nr:(d)CMP kinase [Gemmatimonadota bacterium]